MAARTAATVGDALAIFNTFMAYSPVIAIRITPLADSGHCALEFLLDEPAFRIHPDHGAGARGGARGDRLLLGADYAPLARARLHTR